MLRKIATNFVKHALLAALFFALAFRVSAQSLSDIEAIQNNIDKNQITTENLLIALVTLLLGFILGKFANKTIKKFLSNSFINQDSINIIAGITETIIIIASAFTALTRIGVNVEWIGLLVAFFGILAFLTVKPLIENLSAGILIRARQTLLIGSELLTDDIRGEVIDINAHSVIIKTRDWKSVHIPNRVLLDKKIIIYDSFKRRRSNITLGINYSTSFEKLEKTVDECLKNEPLILKSPKPSIRIVDFGTNTYNIKLRWWHKPSLSHESRSRDVVLRKIKIAFDKNGIQMPAPEMVVKKN